MNPDLPRWDIVLHAWRILIENSGAALRLSVLPFLLFLAMHRVDAIVDPQGLAVIPWKALYIVAFTVPATMLLVPWYRMILATRWPELAERPAAGWYLAFLMRTLGIELMLYAVQLPSIVASVLASVGEGEPEPGLAILIATWFLAMPLGFYLYARVGMALPAAAGGHADSYGRSWAETAGAGWRIAMIVFMLWVPFFMMDVMLMSGVPDGAASPPPPEFAVSVIEAAIDAVRELVMAAALALVYLHYNGAPPLEDVFS